MIHMRTLRDAAASLRSYAGAVASERIASTMNEVVIRDIAEELDKAASEGSQVPVTDLAEVAAQRDEAQEALRELADAISDVSWGQATYDHDRLAAARRQLNAARSAATKVLEDVERTHALVPIDRAEQAQRAFEMLAEDTGSAIAKSLAKAFRAAARGEHVEWPSS